MRAEGCLEDRRSDAGRRRADGAATTLLAALPHEIRRSLGVISILSDAGDGAAPAIAAEVNRLDRLVAAVSEVSRVISGTRAIALGPVDPADATRAALASFAHDPDACPVADEVPSALPDVLADPELVERVLLNLLSNAARHGAPPVVLGGRAVAGHVELIVTDGGNGIPAVRPDGPGAPGAMGVGLSICRLFAGEMGARLVVSERPGESRVTLRLRTVHP